MAACPVSLLFIGIPVRIAVCSVGLFLSLSLIPAFGGIPGFVEGYSLKQKWPLVAPKPAAEAAPSCVLHLKKVATLRGERTRLIRLCGEEVALLTESASWPPVPPRRPKRLD